MKIVIKGLIIASVFTSSLWCGLTQYQQYGVAQPDCQNAADPTACYQQYAQQLTSQYGVTGQSEQNAAGSAENAASQYTAGLEY